jgi:pyruvate dehydrogenase E1 component beta subunit
MQNKKYLSVVEIIRNTLIYVMKKDKSVILFGEGIDDDAAIFGTTKGLSKIFGPKRVFEMPLSENLFVGAAIGSSYLGDKVIVNLHRVEFALLALEQIINNAAKSYYISNGKHNVPIVIRLIVGRGWGQGPAHSQSLETIFSLIPGLKVFMPVFPQENQDLLYEAIKDPNPVIIIENRWCHYNFGKIKKNYKKNNSACLKLNPGKKLTIFSTGYDSVVASRVCKFLNNYSINIQHIHIRKLNPVNINQISRFLTSKVIFLDSGLKKFGFFSEIITQLFEKNNSKIKSFVRKGLPDHPIPSSRGLIKDVYTNFEKILKLIFSQISLNRKTKNKIVSDFKKTKYSNFLADVPNENFKGPF